MKAPYFLIFLFGLGAVGLTAGCNTAEGFGRDMQMAGQGIANTAEKVKEDGLPKPPPPPPPPEPSR